MLLGALQADRVANLGVLLVVGLIVIAVTGALLARAVVAKVVTAVVLLGLMLVVWSQRTALQECAARARADSSGDAAARCSFLGLKVDVNLP
jgi:hypothetical protein